LARDERLATVERSVRARGARVYVDYLLNIREKTPTPPGRERRA